jgi:DNA-directed RNA polymerase subunit RPC12/RpoP
MAAANKYHATTNIDHKICNSCGADVMGKERQKDGQGRYWCMACAKKADKQAALSSPQGRVKILQCPDCGQHVSPVLMKQFEGNPICPMCLEIRTHLQTKAQEQRLAAAREGEDEKRQRFILYGVLGITAALLVFNVFLMVK